MVCKIMYPNFIHLLGAVGSSGVSEEYYIVHWTVSELGMTEI